jgi:2,3-bisphosphoglycerate-dependent phosphoglycerate mutase
LYQTSALPRDRFTERAMTDRFEQRAFAVPRDASELVIVRHGASATLERGKPFALVGGHSDPPLSAAGERQAEVVGERLRDEPFRALFVTPLQRTARTAAPLAAASGLEPEVLEDLREVHLGEWEGGEYRIRLIERDPVAMRALMEERWDAIPGGEPMDSLAERVGRGLDAMLAAIGPGGTGVAFLHGGVIGEICRQVTHSRPFAFIHADNASITRLVAFASGHRLLRSFNDTGHLDGG